MKRFLVGLGNWTMGDDSVGLRVVERIVEKKLDKAFEAVLLPDSGLNLIDYFTPETEKIVIVDTVRSGKRPGEFVFFRPEDVESRKELPNVSSHEGDILKVIELARQLKYPIPEIVVLGIEPERVGPGELTRTIEERLDAYVTAALSQL